MSAHNGLSTHEMVMEIRADLKDHIKDSNDIERRITREILSRPTRGEVVRWAGGLASLAAFSAFLS
jgi:hypothetical protein